MTILIAPDKFKGSLSAHEVCEIVSGELRSNGSFQIVALPLADGGEGTCELLTTFSGGIMIKYSSTRSVGTDHTIRIWYFQQWPYCVP